MAIARLDRHLFATLAKGAFIVLLPLLALEAALSFVDEVRHLDQGQTVTQLVLLSLHRLPIVAYDFLPIAVFIGGLFGFGNLLVAGEITAALASGYSRRRLGASVMASGLIFVLLTAVLGEWVTPERERIVAAMQGERGPAAWKSDSPFSEKWMRIGRHYIYADRLDEHGVYSDLHIYRLGEDGNLERIIKAKTMKGKRGRYVAEGLNQALIDDGRLIFSTAPRLVIAPLPAAAVGGILPSGDMPPQWMSMRQLWHYTTFLRDSGLRHDIHSMAMWMRLSHPLSILALLFLLLPFVFIAHGRKGQNLFFGVIAGLAYSIAVRGFSGVALAYHWPVWIGAFLPLLLLMLTAAVLLFFIRRLAWFRIHYQARA